MKKILLACNAAISALLSLLGFGCDIVGPDEYGTPSADFIISGRVSSSAGQPVKGIAVAMHQLVGMDDDGRDVFSKADSTATDDGGQYRVLSRGAVPEDQAYRLTFSDVDGAANGAFRDTTRTVYFIDPTFVGKTGNWHSGEAGKEVNVELRPKE